jgi:putative endonuclease
MTAENWQVYILRCRDDTLYTGITNNLEQRLQRHNHGTASRYTRTRLPVTLIYREAALDRSQASRREAEIKKLNRQAKLALAARNHGNGKS